MGHGWGLRREVSSLTREEVGWVGECRGEVLLRAHDSVSHTGALPGPCLMHLWLQLYKHSFWLFFKLFPRNCGYNPDCVCVLVFAGMWPEVFPVPCISIILVGILFVFVSWYFGVCDLRSTMLCRHLDCGSLGHVGTGCTSLTAKTPCLALLSSYIFGLTCTSFSVL